MQGFNMGRYHPPSTLDTALAPPTKRSRLSSSTSKPAQPTIRFEMPFAIWCSTCPSSSSSAIIGQGVRFNALKTRVGNYHSTPIWSFRMKHTACGGWLEIRTDPQHSEYVVTEGARKRDTGSDEAVAERVGGVLVGGADEESERERRRTDAFAALEGKKEEKERVKGEAKRLEMLRSRAERDWRDPDAVNKRLRDGFRPGRKARAEDRKGVEGMKEMMGLGIEILEEDERDVRRAGFVEFGVKGGDGDVAGRPIFEDSGGGSRNSNGKTESGKSDALRKELSSNTRAAVDPFSTAKRDPASSVRLPGLKRKKQEPTEINTKAKDLVEHHNGDSDIERAHAGPVAGPVALVNYESE